jgi:hypothetical protein
VRPAQTTAENVVSVTGTQDISGATWFVVSFAWVGEPEPWTTYGRHDATGLLWKDGPGEPEYYRLKSPVVAGATWGMPSDPSRTFRITKVGEGVTVPAGTFSDCVVVEDTVKTSGQPDDVLTSWLAKGVGPVREEEHLGSTLVYLSQLKQYSLAGK